MKKKSILMLGLPIIVLILELLPWGVVMRFMGNPGGEPTIVRTSYFDFTPFGYANFAPLITAVLTCVLLMIVILYVIKRNPKMLNTGKIIAIVAAIISVCPLLISSYSLIGGIISLCLACESILLRSIQKSEN